MGRKSFITTELLLTRLKEYHGDKYDYSLVKYESYSTPIKLLCREHGIFEKRIIKLDQNCPKCADISRHKKFDKRRKTTEQFIKDAIQIHGDVYDYSKVEYKNTHTKVIITCELPLIEMRGFLFRRAQLTISVATNARGYTLHRLNIPTFRRYKKVILFLQSDV